jgi:D-galactonate transporter
MQNVSAQIEVMEFESATYRKITARLIPYLFVCYILAYIDRVNVGFAKLQMQQDLGMSDAVYGLGAGIFFIGYFFFEVPANMIMQRIGARLWIGPIMVAWGIVSACTLFVTGAASFYALRFLLGIVESGFFPGVILYLTYWYTRKHRVKMIAAFMTAVPLSGVIAGPISGWILEKMGGAAGLTSWQWLFLVEGIPSVAAGLVTIVFLSDSPGKAKWLTQEEKALVLRRLKEEENLKSEAGHTGHRLMDAFRSPAVWILCLVHFGFVGSNYGIGFWLPQVIKDTLTHNTIAIGWLSVIPWAAAAVAMNIVGRHSDRTGERRWHLALAGMVVAVSFAMSAIPGISGPAGLAALTMATMGIMSGLVVFWALPTSILSGSAAAAGIAWINAVGNLAGYVSPYVVGMIRDATHGMTAALIFLSSLALLASILSLYVARKSHLK